MHTVRWLFAIILGTASIWLIARNWGLFWCSVVHKRHAPDHWIPFLGGALGALAILWLPYDATHAWWWVPFVLDWGSAPGMIQAAAFRLWRLR